MGNIKAHGSHSSLDLLYRCLTRACRIPLERGREVAQRYGVAPLLSPLFDFVPTTNSLVPLPSNLSNSHTSPSPRPLSASSSFSSIGNSGNYMPTNLGPAPIMPGSALRLLNQGRAQGLFTPSTSAIHSSRPGNYSAPAPPYFAGYSQPSPYAISPSALSPTPTLSQQSLKRNRSDLEADASTTPRTSTPFLPTQSQDTRPNASTDARISDGSRPASTVPQTNGEDGPSPTKRARKELSPLHNETGGPFARGAQYTSTATFGHAGLRTQTATPPMNGLSCSDANHTS
jgi:regulatory protein SWI6